MLGSYIRILYTRILYSYTPRTPCCSQSELMILKIYKSSAHALFLYNCTPLNFEHLTQCLHARKCCVWLIHLLHAGLEIRILEPGAVLLKTVRKLLLIHFFVHKFIWESRVFYHPAGTNLLFCSCYFKAWLHGYQYFVDSIEWRFLKCLKTVKCHIYNIWKRQKVCLCCVWIRIITALKKVLENCDKIMHFCFSFVACPMHSSFGFV